MTDFLIADHGSIVSIRPMSVPAREWLDANIVAEPWQWFDGVVAVEYRCARDVVAELIDTGFAISS